MVKSIPSNTPSNLSSLFVISIALHRDTFHLVRAQKGAFETYFLDSAQTFDRTNYITCTGRKRNATTEVLRHRKG